MQLEKGSVPGNEITPLGEIKQLTAEEEMRYDAPFATLTWKQWLEMHTRIFHNMVRFQRAREHDRHDVALFASLEIQEIAMQIMKEASAAVGRSPSVVRRPCFNRGRKQGREDYP